MKHSEVTTMRRYLIDHLFVSHGFSREELRVMTLALLADRHVEIHKHG